MTTITLPRELVEQVLEALGSSLYPQPRQLAAIAALRAALAQEQPEQTWVCPDSPEHRYAKPGHCEDCGKTLVLAQEQAEPVQEPVALVRTWHKGEEQHAELLDWGIGVDALPDGEHTLYTAPPKLVPVQEPVRNGDTLPDRVLLNNWAADRLARYGIVTCPDCRGIGYDASGQLCACQGNPAPCAYPNCVGGQAGTICKPSCPGGTK